MRTSPSLKPPRLVSGWFSGSVHGASPASEWHAGVLPTESGSEERLSIPQRYPRPSEADSLTVLWAGNDLLAIANRSTGRTHWFLRGDGCGGEVPDFDLRSATPWAIAAFVLLSGGGFALTGCLMFEFPSRLNCSPIGDSSDSWSNLGRTSMGKTFRSSLRNPA